MTPERGSSTSPRIHKIKATSLDESFEVTLASDAESDEDESPEKGTESGEMREADADNDCEAGESDGKPRETDGETGDDPGEDTGQTGKDPGGDGEALAADDQPRPQTIRVQVLGDDDTESDSEVTAEIMDVTKSITQQIMDSAIKNKQEVPKYSTSDSAYNSFGYNEYISLHQNHLLQSFPPLATYCKRDPMYKLH